jgi:hypothetical protein
MSLTRTTKTFSLEILLTQAARMLKHLKDWENARECGFLSTGSYFHKCVIVHSKGSFHKKKRNIYIHFDITSCDKLFRFFEGEDDESLLFVTETRTFSSLASII